MGDESGVAIPQWAISALLSALLGACVLYVGILHEQQNRDHQTISDLTGRVGTLEGTDRVTIEQQDEIRSDLTNLKEGYEIPCEGVKRPHRVFPTFRQ